MANPINTLPKDVLIYTLALAGQPNKTAPVSKKFAEATKDSFSYLRKTYENTEPLKDYCQDFSNLLDVQAVKAVYTQVLSGVEKKTSPWDIPALIEAEALKAKDLLKIVDVIEQENPQIPAYTGTRSGPELEKQVGHWLTGNANTITNLDLQSCNLKFFSASICNLEHLDWLNLGKNQLQTIPKELGNLKNLKELYIHKNPLRDIPEELSNLTNLKILFFNDNLLKSFPNAFKNLKKLKKLCIDKNLVIPPEILNLPNLKIYK